LGLLFKKNIGVEHWIGSVIYEFIPGTLFLTVLSRLLSALFLNLSSNRSLVVLAYLSILLYTGTASFVASYKDPTHTRLTDINYTPRILVVERVLKGILTYVSAIQLDAVKHHRSNNGYDISVLFFLAVYAFFFIFALSRPTKSRQCSVRWFAYVRVGFLSAVLWTIFVTFVNTLLSDFPSIPVLFTGWGILFAMGLTFMAFRCAKPSKYLGSHQHHVKEKRGRPEGIARLFSARSTLVLLDPEKSGPSTPDPRASEPRASEPRASEPRASAPGAEGLSVVLRDDPNGAAPSDDGDHPSSGGVSDPKQSVDPSDITAA